MRKNPAAFFLVPDRFKTQGMCDVVVCMEPLLLAYIANRFKARKMCDKAVRNDHFSVWLVQDWFVPDWFVTQQWIKYLRDNKIIECYDGYKVRKTQKAKIKEELLPIAWHPSRWWDWCVPEDEKKEIIWHAEIKNVLNKHDQPGPR